MNYPRLKICTYRRIRTAMSNCSGSDWSFLLLLRAHLATFFITALWGIDVSDGSTPSCDIKKVNLAVNAGLNVDTNKSITRISMTREELRIKSKGVLVVSWKEPLKGRDLDPFLWVWLKIVSPFGGNNSKTVTDMTIKRMLENIYRFRPA